MSGQIADTETASYGKSYRLTLAQVLFISVLMSFGATLYVCGVLFYMARRKGLAALSFAVSLIGLALYTVVYVLLPLPMWWAIIFHIAANIAAGLLIHKIQSGVLSGQPRFVFWTPAAEKAPWKNSLFDAFFIGLLIYCQTIPIMIASYYSRDFEAVLKMNGMYSAVLQGLWAFAPAFIVGLYWSRKKGSLRITNIYYLYLSPLAAIPAMITIGVWLAKFSTVDFGSNIASDIIGLTLLAGPAAVFALFMANEETVKGFFKRLLLVLAPSLLVFWNVTLISQDYLPICNLEAEKYGAKDDTAGLRKAAFWNTLIIQRFADSPESLDVLAARASQRYRTGDIDGAEKDYARIADAKYTLRTREAVLNARYILSRMRTGKGKTEYTKDLLPVLREDYLNANWLSLVTAVQHIEKGTDEKTLKQRLLKLSKEKRVINLASIDNCAAAAANIGFLGYRVVATSGNEKLLKKLISSGITATIGLKELPLKTTSAGLFDDDEDDDNYDDEDDDEYDSSYSARRNETGKVRYMNVAGYDDRRGMFILYNFSREGKKDKKTLTEGEIKNIVYQNKELSAAALKKDVDKRRHELRGEIISEMTYRELGKRWAGGGRELLIILPEKDANAKLDSLGLDPVKIDAETKARTLSALGDHYFNYDDYVQALRYYFASDGTYANRYARYMAGITLAKIDTERFSAGWAADIDRYSGRDEYSLFLASPGAAEKAAAYRNALAAALKSKSLDPSHYKIITGAIYNKTAAGRKMLLEAYKEIAYLEPENTMARKWLASYYFNTGDFMNSLTQYHILNSGSADHGLLDRKVPDADLLREAVCAAEVGDYKAAERGYTEAKGVFTRTKTSDEYYYAKGRVEMSKGRTKAAARDFKRAIEYYGLNPRYHLWLAKADLKLGRREDAERQITWARKIDYDGPVAREAESLMRKTGTAGKRRAE